MTKTTSKNITATRAISKQKKTDIDIIRERLAVVIADKELFREALIKSGVYDSNLKLTAAYR